MMRLSTFACLLAVVLLVPVGAAKPDGEKQGPDKASRPADERHEKLPKAEAAKGTEPRSPTAQHDEHVLAAPGQPNARAHGDDRGPAHAQPAIGDATAEKRSGPPTDPDALLPPHAQAHENRAGSVASRAQGHEAQEEVPEAIEEATSGQEPAAPRLTLVETEPNGTPVLEERPTSSPVSPMMEEAMGSPVQAVQGGSMLSPAEPAPELQSQRGWIGGLLNATQDARERTAQAQAAAPAVVSSPLFFLLFGIAVGASTSVVGLRRITRRSFTPKPTVEPDQQVVTPIITTGMRPALRVLVDRVTRAPMDGVACFQLAIELLKLGIEQDGLRLLDRSIRINPLHVVQLLQEPGLAGIRQSAGVRRLLADVKRDYDRRLLTAYA